MEDEITKSQQVAAQCNCVVQLANNIASVYADKAKMFHDGHGEEILDLCGKDSAALMELLGEILNGMDAVTEEDKWMTPIYQRAHVMFPVKTRTA